MAQKQYASWATIVAIINNIKNLFATKTELDTKADTNHDHDGVYATPDSVVQAVSTSQTYTDNAVATKSAVQIITWEADD